MNYGMFTGVLCTIPSVAIIPIGERDEIFICKFVLCTSENVDGNMQYDFFECVAFEDTAKAVHDGFYKGAKVNVFGKVKNFTFKDANNTAHFTNIVLAEHVELGDNVSGSTETGKVSVIAELKEMDRLYKEVCDNGFLCIDENDYYYIALNNMPLL